MPQTRAREVELLCPLVTSRRSVRPGIAESGISQPMT